MPGRENSNYLKWKPEQMEAAYYDVVKGNIPIATAARDHGVPRRSLGDRVHGRVPLHAKMGAALKLSKELERDLVAIIRHMAVDAIPLTITQVIRFAGILDRKCGEGKFGTKGPSYNWWLRFRQMYANEIVRLKCTDKLDRCLIKSSPAENNGEYFQLLRRVYERNDLQTKPERIFIVDEVIVDLQKSTQLVVVPKRQMQSTCLNGKHYVSLLFTAAASGTAMPPAIIFNESFPSGVFTRGGPDGCLYGMCDSNFIDSDVILEWFKKIFLRYCPQDRTKANPVLLMLDGHDSHGDPQLLLRAIEEHVIVLERGAPNTQMCQPLDVAVYKSFKSQIEQMVQKEHALGCSRDVKRKKIPQLLKEPIKSAMTVQNITSGFKETGVYPLDPNTVDKKQLIRSRRIPSVDLALPPEFRSKDAAVQVDFSAVSPRKEIPKVSKDPSLDLEGPTEAKEEKDTCKARGPNVKVDYYKHQTTRHQREGKEKNEKIREEMRADKRKRQVMSHTRTERSQREKEGSMPVAKKVKRGNLENGKGYINESGRLFSFVNGSISEADVQILVTQREDNEDS